MTIQANYNPVSDVGNGSTTTFNLPWPFRAQADVVAIVLDANGNPVGSPPVLNGGGTYDYTITGTPDPDTGFYPSGNVVFNTALPAGYIAYRARSTLNWQDKSFPTNGRFPAKSVEAAVDRRTLVDQEQSFALPAGTTSGGRVVRMNPLDLSSFNPVLPNTPGAGGMLLGEKADASGLQWYNFSAGPILSLVGTANQINVSPLSPAGQQVISLPSKVSVVGSANDYTSVGFTWSNSSTGNTAATKISATNYNSEISLQIQGTGWTADPALRADAGILFASGAGGLTVGTNAVSSGILHFMVHGVEQAHMDARGYLGLGAIPDPGYNVALQISKSISSGELAISVNNTYAGTGQASASVHVANAANDYGALLISNANATGMTLPYAPDQVQLVAWTQNNGLLIGTGYSKPIVFMVSQAEVARFLTAGGLDIGFAGNGAFPNYTIQAQRSVNSASGVFITNPNTGNAVQSQFVAQNDAGHFASLTLTGAGFTSAGAPYAPDLCYLSCGAAAGGMLLLTGASTPIRFAVNSTLAMQINSNASVFVGSSTTSGLFGVYGDGPSSIAIDIVNNSGGAVAIRSYHNTVATAYKMYFNNPNGIVGNINTTGSTTAYATSSDYRLKDVKGDADTAGSLARINKLHIHHAKFKVEADDQYRTMVLAHEVQELWPHVVFGEKDGRGKTPEEDGVWEPAMQSIDFGRLGAPDVLAAIQELTKRLTTLEKRKH